MKLVDRRAERGMLDRLVQAVRADVRDNLLGLEVVPPDGHAPAPGYDTKRLFVGSRRAFGTITTAIFKITVNARGGSC
jgi:FAD/FMN-containing dehydrogenase